MGSPQEPRHCVADKLGGRGECEQSQGSRIEGQSVYHVRGVVKGRLHKHSVHDSGCEWWGAGKEHCDTL